MKLKEKFGKIKDALKKANPFKSKQSKVNVTPAQQPRVQEQIESHHIEERTADELEIGEESPKQIKPDDEVLEFYDSNSSSPEVTIPDTKSTRKILK